jgi:hypothetical protein
MKRGAANIALRGNIDLTPVVITVSEPMLGKCQRWYQAPLRRPHFVLTVLDDIPMASYVGMAKNGDGSEEASGAYSLMARALTHDLGALFVREIKRQAV